MELSCKKMRNGHKQTRMHATSAVKSILVGLLVCLTQLLAQENKPSGLAAGEKEAPAATQAGVPSPARPLTEDDVLSIRDGQFFLDGKPFAEISFNKFDLFWHLYDQLAAAKPLEVANPMVQAQDRALRNLHELGFRTIRIFALPWGPEGPASYVDREKRQRLYAALDKALELCDAHDIRVVWSLGAGSFTDTKLDPRKGWVYGDEQQRELVANPESRSRKLLYRYIDETVARYKRRKAVVMWEISNEVTLQADIGDGNRVFNGERMPTLKDVAGFFDDVAKRIKAADPLRLVNSGGSNMRESQWHLHLGKGWRKDSFEEQFKCFELLYANSAVDVIDIHSYPNGKPGYLITDDTGKELWLDNKGYMAISKRLNKPLMIGELGLQPAPKTEKEVWRVNPNYFESYEDTDAAKPWFAKTLNEVVEAGVPLTYWWCYQADRSGDQNNRQRLDIDRNRNPELVACLVEANRRLQATTHSERLNR
jgi:Cellulase (glycosyl hydrolase family 5)